MRHFQDTFETSKQSLISAFSIYMTVHLIKNINLYPKPQGLCNNEILIQ